MSTSTIRIEDDVFYTDNQITVTKNHIMIGDMIIPLANIASISVDFDSGSESKPTNIINCFFIMVIFGAPALYLTAGVFNVISRMAILHPIFIMFFLPPALLILFGSYLCSLIFRQGEKENKYYILTLKTDLGTQKIMSSEDKNYLCKLNSIINKAKQNFA